MVNFLRKIKTNTRDSMIKYARGNNTKWYLSFFSFAEASFFPIPPDFLLMAILGSGQEHRWIYYSFLTSIGSVFGGIFGYMIGFLLFDSVGQWLISLYSLQEYMIVVKEIFNQNAFWTIFISGFTPIPYKVFTISAGFFGINLIIFIIASIISRFLRFFIVGFIMKVFGKDISRFVYNYFNILTFIFVIGVIIFIVILNIY